MCIYVTEFTRQCSRNVDPTFAVIVTTMLCNTMMRDLYISCAFCMLIIQSVQCQSVVCYAVLSDDKIELYNWSPAFKRTGSGKGRDGTAAAVPPPFRPSKPVLCGSCPLVIPYYCRLGDLLCYTYMLYLSTILCVYACVFCVFFVLWVVFLCSFLLQYFDTVGWVF